MAKSQRTCSIDGCNRAHAARGYCDTHWHRWRAHGDPNLGGPIKSRKTTAFDYIVTLVNSDISREECIKWPYSQHPSGYGQLTKDGKKLYAHRAVCEAAHGAPPSSEHVAAHSCGRGKEGCVNPRHLRWATNAENSAEYVEHQTSRFGVMPTATVSPSDVKAIRALHGVIPHSRIAELFSITPSAVRLIIKRVNWAWMD